MKLAHLKISGLAFCAVVLLSACGKVHIPDSPKLPADPPVAVKPPSPAVESPKLPATTPKPPPEKDQDKHYEEKLIGTWETQLITDSGAYVAQESFYPSKEYSGTAAIVNDAGEEFLLVYSGKWRIEKGYLHYTTTASNVPEIMPSGTVNANRIINITDRDYVYIDNEGNQQIDRRVS